MITNTKTCTKCGETKIISEFSGVIKKHPWCKKCSAQNARDRHKIPEVAERQKAWQKAYLSKPEVREHNKIRARARARKKGVLPIDRGTYDFSWAGIPEGKKRCTHCQKIKPLTEFEPRKDCKFGVSPYCRICRCHERTIRARKKGRASKYDKMVLIVDINGHPHRKCMVCGELLPLSEFSEHKNNGTLLERGAVCKSCICKKQSDKIKCIRQFCKKYSSLTNTLKCPVCGKEIGVTKTELKTRKYCSRDCYWKTLTKSWRERSPYAKNIKRIRKEQRL